MGIIVFIVSAVIAFFVFCKTNSVALTTIVMFSGVLIMSRSMTLFCFFIFSVFVCYLIDINAKKFLS